MRQSPSFSLFLRLSLPLLFTLAFGLAPRPQALEQQARQAHFALQNGDYATAAQALAGLAEDQPWRANLWEEAGRAALNAGDIQSAIQHFEQAESQGELSIDGLVLLGDAYGYSGETESARQVWLRLLELQEPPAAGIFLRLADEQRLSGEYEAAIQTLRQLLEHYPGQTSATYQLGLLLAATQPELAVPYLEQAGELDPALGERTQMLAETIRSARFEEEPAYTLVAAGRALSSLDEWRLADLAFSRASTARPDYAEAWAYLGYARDRLGENGKAALDRALAINPDSLASNLFTALHFAQTDRPELALIYLHQAVRLDPTSPLIQIEIGNILAEMGDLVSARRHYQRSLELAGNRENIWQMTAEFALRYNVDVRELALPAARQAVLLDPHNPSTLDTLGQVLFKLGDPLTARRFFRSALQEDPGYAPAHVHLGLVYLLFGEIQAAQEHFNLAITLAPDSPAAVQAERLLANPNP
jgi:tetratricopeptide (TPR) repeat protein